MFYTKSGDSYFCEPKTASELSPDQTASFPCLDLVSCNKITGTLNRDKYLKQLCLPVTSPVTSSNRALQQKADRRTGLGMILIMEGHSHGPKNTEFITLKWLSEFTAGYTSLLTHVSV